MLSGELAGASLGRYASTAPEEPPFERRSQDVARLLEMREELEGALDEHRGSQGAARYLQPKLLGAHGQGGGLTSPVRAWPGVAPPTPGRGDAPSTGRGGGLERQALETQRELLERHRRPLPERPATPGTAAAGGEAMLEVQLLRRREAEKDWELGVLRLQLAGKEAELEAIRRARCWQDLQAQNVADHTHAELERLRHIAEHQQQENELLRTQLREAYEEISWLWQELNSRGKDSSLPGQPLGRPLSARPLAGGGGACRGAAGVELGAPRSPVLAPAAGRQCAGGATAPGAAAGTAESAAAQALRAALAPDALSPLAKPAAAAAPKALSPGRAAVMPAKLAAAAPPAPAPEEALAAPLGPALPAPKAPLAPKVLEVGELPALELPGEEPAAAEGLRWMAVELGADERDREPEKPAATPDLGPPEVTGRPEPPGPPEPPPPERAGSTTPVSAAVFSISFFDDEDAAAKEAKRQRMARQMEKRHLARVGNRTSGASAPDTARRSERREDQPETRHELGSSDGGRRSSGADRPVEAVRPGEIMDPPPETARPVAHRGPPPSQTPPAPAKSLSRPSPVAPQRRGPAASSGSSAVVAAAGSQRQGDAPPGTPGRGPSPKPAAAALAGAAAAVAAPASAAAEPPEAAAAGAATPVQSMDRRVRLAGLRDEMKRRRSETLDQDMATPHVRVLNEALEDLQRRRSQ